MAGLGNGLNSISHANIMHGLNLIKEEPFTDGPIACRVCGHVFLNNAALFDHIEIHLVIDEEDARRKVLLSHMTPSQRALFTTLVDQPTAAGNGGGDHDMQSPSATAPPSPTSGESSSGNSNNNNNYYMPRPIRTPYGVIQVVYVPQAAPQEPREMVTRPLINLLDDHLFMDGMTRIFEMQMAAEDEEEPTVDLTLKL